MGPETVLGSSLYSSKTGDLIKQGTEQSIVKDDLPGTTLSLMTLCSQMFSTHWPCLGLHWWKGHQEFRQVCLRLSTSPSSSHPLG
eukprot:13981855-Heterocapsa_arctica.AAC.1